MKANTVERRAPRFAGLRTVGVVLGALFSVLLLGTAANAQATPDAAISAGFGSLIALVVGVLAASLFGIAVASLGIKMGVNWLRKGASQ